MILPINKVSDPKQLKILQTPCARNRSIEATHLVDNLLETAKANENCVGLSSNQVWETDLMPAPHVFVAFIKNGWKVFIDSTSKRSGPRISIIEGCMSKPGYKNKIIRRGVITISYYDVNGEQRTERYEGMDAIILQHELDHMNGALI
jgi:peptide deformylase